MHPNSKALFGGLLGSYLSRDSAPMASAWVATLAHTVTTAAFSAWVSVIVQELLALSPCSDRSEQVWAHPLAALVIKRKGGEDLGGCPHSLVTPEAPCGLGDTYLLRSNGYSGKGQHTVLLACWPYQLLAS